MQWWVVLWAMGLIIGCSNQKSQNQPILSTQLKETASFALEKDARTNQARLAIRRSALQKEMLLLGFLNRQSAMSDINPSLTHALTSRVVKFQQKDKQLIMEESPVGHTSDASLQPKILLGVFPILSEDEERIFIDLNAGLSRVYTDRGASTDERTYKPRFEWDDLTNRYLDGVKLRNGDIAEIRQIAQLPVTSRDANGQKAEERLETFEISYLLKSYVPNAGFEKGAPSDPREMRFFETHPMMRAKQGVEVFPFKIDIRKPFVFAYTKNTPSEYVEAIRDGVEYWNRIFGKQVLSLIAAPDGVRAPSYEYNLIQWLDYDDGRMSYFQSQVDPRSGEVLHAHVYLSSGQSGSVKRGTVKWVQSHSHSWHAVGDSDHLECDFPANDIFGVFLENFKTVKPTKEMMTRVHSDGIRATVAHEVGHAMGLRHNFAGNLYRRNYDPLKRNTIFKAYLEKNEIPEGLIPMGSVMEYGGKIEDILLGKVIQLKKEVLPHDRKAVEFLYLNKRSSEAIPFCTDDDVGTFADCERFDVGSNPVEEAVIRSQDLMGNLRYSAIESFAMAKASSDSSLESLSIDPNDLAREYWKGQMYFVTKMLPTEKGTGTKGKLLQVRSKYPKPQEIYSEKMGNEEWEIFRNEVSRFGGLSKVLPAFRNDAVQQLWKDNFKALNAPPMIYGINGEELKFPDSEWKHVSNQIEIVFEKLPFYAAKIDALMWNRLPGWWKAPRWKIAGELATVLNERASEYIMARTGKTIDATITLVTEKLVPEGAPKPKPVTVTATVKLPEFGYAHSARTDAVGLLRPAGGEGAQWAKTERVALSDALFDLLAKELGTKVYGHSVEIAEVKTVDGKTDDDLEQKVEDWLTENVEIALSLRTIKPLKP